MTKTGSRKLRSGKNRIAVGLGRAAKRALATGKHKGAVLRSGKVVQPERELPVKHVTDVLVVGGGPAGVAAAIAARRTGANVALMERYGYFGGLFTGGMVLLLQGTYARLGNGDNIQVARGFNAEVIKRLMGLGAGCLIREQGHDPTADPEAAKYVLGEMIRESGVKVFLHCWGVDAIMEGANIRGAVFESKSGRQAIRAKIVIDASGDGDIYAVAGADYQAHAKQIGLVHRLLNAAGEPGPKTPIPNVRWNGWLVAEKADALDVDVLTRLEMDYRKQIWEHARDLRQQPGNENMFLLDVAAQLGIRISRLLKGVAQCGFMKAGTSKDVVGVASHYAGGEKLAYIPYGALLPRRVDNLLVAGRCVSMDLQTAELVRLIPACFTTGQAAGVAAALALKDNCAPRNVDVARLQQVLKDQGAYLV